MEIDITIARKVLQVVDAGLVSGMGKPIPGQMCVEAAVCYAMGLPHGDGPSCVAPALRRLKIGLNDARWSSDVERSKGLRRLALAQLGSAGALEEKEFVRRVVRLAIQTSVPQALRAAAGLARGQQEEDLLAAADLCERDPTHENALKARTAVGAVAYAAAAADAATYAATYAAAGAVAGAAAAADAAAYAAADSAADSARDRSLAAFCESVVQILIEMKAPGCEWLRLTEEEGGEIAS